MIKREKLKVDKKVYFKDETGKKHFGIITELEPYSKTWACSVKFNEKFHNDLHNDEGRDDSGQSYWFKELGEYAEDLKNLYYVDAEPLTYKRALEILKCK